MAELAQLLRQKPKTVQIDHDGDVLNITFDVNAITPAWQELTQSEHGLGAGLAAVILDWDVVENGQPWPPTADHLGGLPFPLQRVLLERLVDAAVPGAAEGNASSAPTSIPSTASAEPPPTSQNGLATSASLAPLASPSTR
jgi:hypothetical protein